MGITLAQILNLVGLLKDEGDAKERFRTFLKDNVKDVGQLRDYIYECLRSSGDQYNRALQDLVNHLATFLGFDSVFGRYHGITGEIGFDGLWKSPTGFFIVAEVKTSEAYAIKTAPLLGYIDALISDNQIPDREHALGLYVVGRPDADLRQLEHAIIAEKRSHQLRTISVESLLSLADLYNEYDVSHEDVLAVLKPSLANVDPVVDMMARLVAQRPPPPEDKKEQPEEEEEIPAERSYWLTPVRSDEEQTADEVIESLVKEEHIYAFGERTPGRRNIKPGDLICFYSTGKGVVAHAQVASLPEYKVHPKVHHSDKYPWVFRVKDAHLYLDDPVIIDAALRGQLDAFKGREDKAWAWFVQATRRVSEHDFRLLTQR
ncbi:MAG TPA: EVE domain-containing protein [Methanomicrobia archaeon]|nr:EVE domain-containing protein [Methanomicrobia archaeon]